MCITCYMPHATYYTLQREQAKASVDALVQAGDLKMKDAEAKVAALDFAGARATQQEAKGMYEQVKMFDNIK